MRITWKQAAAFTFQILKQIFLFTFQILTIGGCIGHPFCEEPEDEPEVEFVEVGVVQYPEPEDVIVDPPKPMRPGPDAGTRHR